MFIAGISALPVRIGAATVIRKDRAETKCTLYRSINGTPEDNIKKIVEMLGGISRIVGHDDVVVIKPNGQWWNQGAPNLSAVKTFIELVMDQDGGFHGEIIIAENCHRGESPSTTLNSGWAPRFERNADIVGVNNLNELSIHLKKKYGSRFSTVHWLDVSCGGKRVFGPKDGNGYVYCDGTGGIPLITCDNGRTGYDYRATIMSYPIFTTDKGTVIDFMHGIWRKGAYTGQQVRFINFSALNHHSDYCGITSAVKNHMGISDLSGGPDPHNNGRLTGKYYNFHSFPFNHWAPGPEPGMLGKEIGVFLKSIRKADLNITTAEWCGIFSRTEPPVAHTRAILACTDPVALDYHGAKYILYPNSKVLIHNPDNKQGPLNQYLTMCSDEYGGYFDENKVAIQSYDYDKKRFQRDDELAVIGGTTWGNDLRQIKRLLYLRYFSYLFPRM
jgi:hypothetical protein